MDRYAKQEAKSKVIESTVRSYFQEKALETFAGDVCCGDILSAVQNAIKDTLGTKARMTEYNRGEAFDLIRELGPVGENDARWIALWGQCGAENEQMSA